MNLRYVVLLLTACFACSASAKELSTEKLPVKVVNAFPNLETKIERPIIITNANDGSNRLFVASQLGKIYVMGTGESQEEAEVFIDLTESVEFKMRENEEGLLGFAFHPDYKSTGKFYVYYTTTDEPHTSVISEYSVSPDNANRGNADSQREVFRLKQPFWNHNGGTIVFGPDGYLYVGLGDGGAANDPAMNGQNLQTLLGSILRIDVNQKSEKLGYGIPSDNPFVGHKKLARGEIFAYGVRNIWRMSFDRKTGKLWAADVGQNLWEEINIIEKGGNYGWNRREGKHGFGPGGIPANDTMVEPVFEYDHEVGKSITGGVVYRGEKVAALQGKYLYADYVTGKVWALSYDEATGEAIGNHMIAEKQMPIITFGEDEKGEAYYATDSHKIFKFAAE